jgi:DNA-binding MarR family transcriptional regulator
MFEVRSIVTAVMATSDTLKPKPQSALERDTVELSGLFGGTMRNLKSSGQPPQRILAVLQTMGMGPRHIPPLLAIAMAGPLSVTELSQRLGLQLSTTSTVVGELSRAGLLERVEDDRDRRRTIIHIPEEYRDELASWLHRAIAPIRETLERLTPQARTNFIEGWRILHEESARGGTGNCDEG